MEANPDPSAAPSGAFYGRRDWLTFGAATLLALGVYVATLAPSVTMEDSGELVVAADHMGVPHPPGYPVWTMISWLFARIFSFVTFRGQPNPAWAVSLVSAVCGALTIGALAMLIGRSGRAMLDRAPTDDGTPTAPDPWHRRYSALAALSVGLLFSFTHAMWSQAVIAEIYTLNALFLALILLFTCQWMHEPTDRHLLLTAFVFGLSLANYYTLLLIILPLAVLLLLNDTRLFRDFAIAALPYVLLLVLAKYMNITPLVLLGKAEAAPVSRHLLHPAEANFQIYLFLNFLILTAVWFFLPRGRTVAGSILMAQLGFAFYLYMPMASDLRNPPMNWGYPRTWHGFVHAVSRGQYEAFEFANVFSRKFIEQLGDFVADLRMQFSLPVALLGFLPFAAWEVRVGGRRFRAFGVAAALAAIGTALAFIEKYAMAPGPAADPLGSYKWVLGPFLILALAGIGILLIGQVRNMIDRIGGGTQEPTAFPERIILGGALVTVGAGTLWLIFTLFRVVSTMFQTVPAAARDSLKTLWPYWRAPALLLVALVATLFVGILIFHMMNGRHKLRMTLDESSQRWLIASLVGFAAMSVVVIIMANPKGNIQDQFVQKVKFISSHAIFSIWIAYGLMLGLARLRRATAQQPQYRLAIVTAVALLPLGPLWQNWTNKRMIEVYGAAEQNGKDFGWQFGNYQLRGAEAMIEELRPDEEPPPNPEYPAAMSPDAIFFGGTDPGRFVPTYMIYSARVREDVYLITQNALADPTYMSVMRDLYGDRIWLPADFEGSRAFQQFADEVQSGRRPKPAHSDIQIENGRVQVTGALGVMEINGILTQWIFDRNRKRHDFYVEESYPIEWMYPQLSPHGLIMKINARPERLSPAAIADDRDFWDWYTRRLTADEGFLRDVAARKSFAKLRTAIGGLYGKRNLPPHAEAAYQEALLLHPLGSEAIFKLVQEVLLRQNRFDAAERLLRTFQEKDPRNITIPPFLNHIQRHSERLRRIAELEEQLKQGGPTAVGNWLELAKLNLDSGRHRSFSGIAAQLLANTNLPPTVHFQLAQMYSAIGQTGEVVRALELGRRNMPDNLDPRIYLEMVKMYRQARHNDGAESALKIYLRALEKTGKPIPANLDPEVYLALVDMRMTGGDTEGAHQALTLYMQVKPSDYRGRLDLAILKIMLKKPPREISETIMLALQQGGTEAQKLIAGNRMLLPYVQHLFKKPPPGRTGPNRRIPPGRR
jgi:tetratricopeptide (TPR) repeat protein